MKSNCNQIFGAMMLMASILVGAVVGGGIGFLAGFVGPLSISLRQAKDLYLASLQVHWVLWLEPWPVASTGGGQRTEFDLFPLRSSRLRLKRLSHHRSIRGVVDLGSSDAHHV